MIFHLGSVRTIAGLYGSGPNDAARQVRGVREGRRMDRGGTDRCMGMQGMSVGSGWVKRGGDAPKIFLSLWVTAVFKDGSGHWCGVPKTPITHDSCTAKFLPSAVDLTVHHRGASLLCGPSICFTIIPSKGYVSYGHCIAYLTLPCLTLHIFPAPKPAIVKKIESIDIRLACSPVPPPRCSREKTKPGDEVLACNSKEIRINPSF